jgi:hypothetical protein
VPPLPPEGRGGQNISHHKHPAYPYKYTYNNVKPYNSFFITWDNQSFKGITFQYSRSAIFLLHRIATWIELKFFTFPFKIQNILE